jgi:hypothetical protein
MREISNANMALFLAFTAYGSIPHFAGFAPFQLQIWQHF